MPVCRGEFRKLEEAAVAAGWEVTRTKGSHIKFKPPSGPIVFASSTPSDFRAWHKVASMLRRAGLDV